MDTDVTTQRVALRRGSALMSRRCTVYSYPRRWEIDACLVSGQSNRSIAKQFAVDDAVVFRHRNAHLLAQVVKAREAREVARADDLLAQIRNLQQKALAHGGLSE